MGNRNKVVGNMFWKFGERILNQGVSFIVSLVLARLLFPEDYGTIALVQVFINLAAVFINSGFATSLIQKKDADDTDYSTIFYCSFACSIVIYVLLFIAAPFVAEFYDNDQLCILLRVFALHIPMSVYNSIQNAYISRNMLFRKQFIVSFITSVISGVIGIVVALLNYGVWALVAQFLSAMIISTLIQSFCIPWRLKCKFSVQSAKSLMRYGSRILGADLSGTFFYEIRSLIIGRAYTSADLAFYNKGQHVPSIINTNLNNTVIAVLFPVLSNSSDDLVQIKQMTRRTTKMLAFIMMPILLGMAAIMEPMIIFMYTERWAESVFFGQIVCIGYALGEFGIIPLQVLKAIGRSEVVFRLEFIKKPIYVLLLLVGVSISVKGLAVAMLIYDLYGTVVNMCQMKKYISYSIAEQAKDLGPTFLLSAVMAFVVLLIPTVGNLFISLLIKIIIGIAVYLGGSALFRLSAFEYALELLKKKIRNKEKCDGTSSDA